MNTNELILQSAKEASKNAYCRYSNFPVGACALYESGNKYIGCNVENESYGLALCAERNAMSNAVVNGEKSKLIKIAVYSPKMAECLPCGACRQWIHEFAQGYNTEIILQDNRNSIKIYYIHDLLPYPFGTL